MTVCDKRSSQKISKVWGDAKDKLKNINLKEINRIRRFYKPSCDYVDNLDNLSSEDCTKLLWFTDEDFPLILFENNLIDKTIQICRDRKYVLIREKVSNESKFEIPTFQKLADLGNFDDIFQDVTTKFKCKLPGNEVSLDYLIRENKEFLDIITTDELLEMVDEPYILQDQQLDLPVPYVSRHLFFSTVNAAYFEHANQDTFIVVTNVPKTESSLRKYFQKDNFHLDENECSWKKFKEICEKKQAKTAHHFRFNKRKLQLVGSIGSVSDLEPYRVEHPLREEESTFYTPKYHNSVNIITEEPGMGKSKLLRSIKNNLSHHLWTVLFLPTDISKICQFLQKEEDRDKIVGFILNLKYPNRNKFQKLILKLLMLTGQVAYLWDGLDEISDKNLNHITDLIYNFSQEIPLQWIASRCHLQKFLQNKFNMFPARITPFDSEQQGCYIKERFYSTRGCLINDDIVSVITTNITFAANTDILGIPQQIFMLTELFLRDQDKYMNLMKNKLFSPTDLYQHFIEEKIIFFYREKTGVNVTENDSLNRFTEKEKTKRLKKYQKAALISIFDNCFLDGLNTSCSEFLEEIQQEGDPFGFITDVDKIPQFVHNSYAEYFSALYFVENYENIPDLKFLFERKYENIRFFFDCLIAKESTLHVAILHKNLETLKQHEDKIKNCVDSGGRNLLHLAISWGRRYDLSNISDLDYPRYQVGGTFSIKDIPKRDKEILEFLVQKCDASKIDHVFKLDCVSYAEECECLLNILVVIPHYQKIDKLKSKSNQFKYNIALCSVYFGYDDAMKCLEDVISYRIRTIQGNTLLHIACQNGHLEIANLLIEFEQKFAYGNCNTQHSIDDIDLQTIDVANNRGSTPLHLALTTPHYDIVKLLIKSHADVNVVDKTGKTPLHLASWNRHYKIAKLLIKSQSFTENGKTPLDVILRNSYYNIAELLIKSNANVDAADKKGETPLHLASMEGQYKLVKLLIKYHANVDAADKNGITPLYWASNNGHCQIVKLLIKAQASIDIINEYGDRPLDWALRMDHEKITELLIESYANIDVNKERETVLHLSLKEGHYMTARLLIKIGANIDVANKNGETPLHWASKVGHNEIAELLIKSKANVDVVDRNRQTPLLCALEMGHYLIANLLIRSKANIDINDKNGETPLVRATRIGHYKLAELLIKYCANVDAADNNGKTPLHWAANMGHYKITELLIKSQASTDVVDKNGKTPLDLASKMGHYHIVQFLVRSKCKN